MAPTLLFAAILGRNLPEKDSSNEHDSEDEHRDPERGGPGTSQDQALDGDNNDGDEADQDIEDLYDDEEKRELDTVAEENERRQGQGQGVPLESTATTISSSSMNTFTRPLLPRWLVKIKEVLFATHDERDEYAPNSSYRRLPIISGSLIPFSILLEIPGLTEHWYVKTDGNQIVESRPNPPLVIVAMSFSMALALLANAALVYRFLERRVKASTIVCIISLTLHDILNIVTCATFAIEHRFDDGFTNGEAFWMTICSTIVSSITNLTLIWDLVRTPNFEKAGSGVTRKQRSLVIITIIFLTYIAIGALISSLSMSLSFVNGLFFTIVTTLTIGFGDIVPVTPAQRFVVCLYAVLGIIILGAAVRLTSEAVLEGLQVGYRRRIREFKNRRRGRKHERQQVRRWRVAVEERLVQRGLDVWTPDKPTVSSPSSTTTTYMNDMTHVRPSTLRRGSNFVPQAMYLNTEALPPDVLEEAALEAGVAPEKFIGRKFGRRARQTPPHHHHHHQQRDQQQEQQQQQQQQQSKEGARPGRLGVSLDYSWTIDDGILHERKNGIWNRTREWWDGACEALRLKKKGSRTSGQADPSEGMSRQEVMKYLEKEERRSLYTKLGLAWATFFTFWTIGSLIFSLTENWRYGAAMYFCFIAFTTIGYGDLAPETAIGRGIFVFWALFGVGAMTVLIAVITDAFSSKYRSVTYDKSFDRAVRQYRQGQDRAIRRKAGDKSRKRRPSVVGPAFQANLARISSRELAKSYCAPKPAQTLEEAESRLRSRIEPLPAMILKEVHRLRDHTRYFVMANGHGDAMSVQVGGKTISPPEECPVPEDLKELLDEIAREGEGFEERMKQEVWDDAHERNTLVLLSLEKGAQKMIQAAELALETLSERDQFLVTEGSAVLVEEPEEIGKDDVQVEAKESASGSRG